MSRASTTQDIPVATGWLNETTIELAAGLADGDAVRPDGLAAADTRRKRERNAEADGLGLAGLRCLPG